MTQRRPVRLVVSSVIAALLAMSAFSGVSAAQPGWTMVVELLPSAVTPGADAGYRLTITNNGPSNISQLYLTSDLAATPTTYLTDTRGVCVGDPELYCDFGALADDEIIVVVLAYSTIGATGSTFDVTFRLDTTGVADDKGKNSHGDTLEVPVSTSLSGDQNFAGGFVLSDGFEVKNGGSLGRRNVQSTSATPTGAFIPVTVEDGPNVPTDTCAAVAGTFGECSMVEVAEGGNVAGGIKIIITVYWKSVPRNLDVNDVLVIHTFDDGVTTETISASCSPTISLDPGCRDAVFLASGDLQITVWTLHNGGFRGGL